MSEEITQVKISMPLIDNIELHRIDNFYNDIVSEYTKAFVIEKEQVIIQRLMMNLQQENKQLKETIKNIKKYIDNNYNQEKRYNHELKAWIRCDDEILEMIEEVSERKR